MIGGVTIMMIVASCCLIDTGVLDLPAKKEKENFEASYVTFKLNYGLFN
jgi:hypothetical protein